MSRATEPWVAKNDDQAIPPRVKVRIFEAAGGRCQECTRQIGGSIRPAYDHRVALINGGRHAEDNLQLLCEHCHKIKTAEDVAEKSKTYERKRKHYGVKTRKRTIPGRKFDGTPVPARWR